MTDCGRYRVDSAHFDGVRTTISVVRPSYCSASHSESLTDATRAPLVRYFSDLSVDSDALPHAADPAADRSGKLPRVFAVVVFRKLIDRAMLEIVARKTGKSPVLLAPDGRHRQQLG